MRALGQGACLSTMTGSVAQLSVVNGEVWTASPRDCHIVLVSLHSQGDRQPGFVSGITFEFFFFFYFSKNSQLTVSCWFLLHVRSPLCLNQASACSFIFHLLLFTKLFSLVMDLGLHLIFVYILIGFF